MEEWNTEPAQSADTIALLRKRLHSLNLTLADVELALTMALAERDAALARVAELEAAQSGAWCATYFDMLVCKAHVAAAKASIKFPQPNYVTLKIAEEAGEVVRGAVHYAEGRMEWSEVEGEIVQLLAMLIRFVTEGDQVNAITPPADLGKGVADE